ncbi:tetraacyldisaccharide 4'-kinase, partial [Acinetobacter baumannii]
MAPDGPLDPAGWGDEPAMFRWLLPDVPLVVGRRRVLAAELVHQHFPKAVLVMDDGFQHLPVKKHIQILLDDPTPKNSRCLPAGP